MSIYTYIRAEMIRGIKQKAGFRVPASRGVKMRCLTVFADSYFFNDGPVSCKLGIEGIEGILTLMY